jgi:hypothetical protein
MGESGLAKIPADDVTLCLSTSAKAPLVITNSDAIPDALCKIERVPRKDDIRKWLDDGNECDGAHFGNPEPILTIRRR